MHINVKESKFGIISLLFITISMVCFIFSEYLGIRIIREPAHIRLFVISIVLIIFGLIKDKKKVYSVVSIAGIFGLGFLFGFENLLYVLGCFIGRCD